MNDTADDYGFVGIDAPGSATIELAHPVVDGLGFDLAVYENGFVSFAGGFFAELAYVEVSSDGESFARFASVSLNTESDLSGSGGFAGIDETNVYNLAGKHATNWGTPFDLAQLVDDPAVVSGVVDLTSIRFVRLVDIPGSGFFEDSLGHPILDAHVTVGSGGFDLNFGIGGVALMTEADAVAGDVDGDGSIGVDDLDLYVGLFGDAEADLTGDRVTDVSDLRRLVTGLIGSAFGDTNLDGRVDLIDLSALATGFGTDAGWGGGDTNGDGMVDLIDLSNLASGFGFEAAVVPSPGAGWLLGVGALLFFRRGFSASRDAGSSVRRSFMEKETMKRSVAGLFVIGLSAGVADAGITVDFDELVTPGPDYFVSAGFVSKGVDFTGGPFAGWSYSDVNDVTTPGFGNQYAAFTGTDVSGDGNYAIGFGDGSFINLPEGQTAVSAFVTNTTYAALSMQTGDSFAKAFGGQTGDDPDLFTVTLTGYSGVDGGGAVTGSAVEVILADYRFADNSQDFIVDTWMPVDLSVLGGARSIGLTFFSTDVGGFGINTPTYVALDELVITPEPGSALVLLGLGALAVRRTRS
ncbi:DUF4465 domain-containing protein [Mucisphaera sp.]|uniref:DUF4465 domain-containing protein n=1 Tax=Mucisphaera sp. TaxID=2913024 RepID=UPI003D0F55A2